MIPTLSFAAECSLFFEIVSFNLVSPKYPNVRALYPLGSPIMT